MEKTSATRCYYCELLEVEDTKAFRTVNVRYCGFRESVRVCSDKSECEARLGHKRVNVA